MRIHVASCCVDFVSWSLTNGQVYFERALLRLRGWHKVHRGAGGRRWEQVFHIISHIMQWIFATVALIWQYHSECVAVASLLPVTTWKLATILQKHSMVGWKHAKTFEVMQLSSFTKNVQSSITTLFSFLGISILSRALFHQLIIFFFKVKHYPNFRFLNSVPSVIPPSSAVSYQPSTFSLSAQ